MSFAIGIQGVPTRNFWQRSCWLGVLYVALSVGALACDEDPHKPSEGRIGQDVRNDGTLPDDMSRLDAGTMRPRADSGPARPFNLRLEAIPRQAVYRPGDTFRLRAFRMPEAEGESTEVNDVQFSVLSTGVVEAIRDDRFAAIASGRATIEGCNVDECGRLPILVSEEPYVQFTQPTPGSMEGENGQDTLIASGQILNYTGTPRLTLNGQRVSVGETGHFEHPVNPRFGINRLDYTASDDTTPLGDLLSFEYLWAAEYLPSTPQGSRIDRAIIGRLDQVTLDADSQPAERNGQTLVADSLAQMLEFLVTEGDASGLVSMIPAFEMEELSIGVTAISFGAADVSIEITDNGLDLVIQTDEARLDTVGFIDLEDRRVSLDGSLIASVAVFAELHIVQQGGIAIEIPEFDIAISSLSGRYQEPTVNALIAGLDNRLGQVARDIVSDVSESLTTELIPRLLETGYAQLAATVRHIPIEVQANVPGVANTAFNLRLEMNDIDHRSLTASWLTLEAFIEHPEALPERPTDRGVPSTGSPQPDLRGGDGLAVLASIDLFNGICHALWRAGLLNGAPELPASTSLLIGQVTYTGLLPPIIRYVDTLGPYPLELQVGSMRLNARPEGAVEDDVYALSFRTGLESSSSGGQVALQTVGAPQIDVRLIEDRSGSALNGAALATLIESLVWPQLEAALNAGLRYGIDDVSVTDESLAIIAPSVSSVAFGPRLESGLQFRDGYFVFSGQLYLEINVAP